MRSTQVFPPPKVSPRTIGIFALLVIVFSLILVGRAHAAQTITFLWDAPTTNADGTPLTDLGGYEIAFGTSSRNYSDIRNVGNVTTVTYSFENGTYYAAVRAYDLAGNRSAYSNEVTFTVQTPTPTPTPTATPTYSRCDVNGDGLTNITDVQLSVNQALGISACTADVNLDGRCDIQDIQRIVNTALGGACVSP